MAQTSDVVAGVRQKLRDFSKIFETDIQGDGSAQIFEFPVTTVDPNTLVVQKLDANDFVTLLVEGTDFTLDAHNGMIILTAGPLDPAHSLNIFGTHYTWFLDEDIEAETEWFVNTLDLSDGTVFSDLATNDPRFELAVRGVLVGCLWSLLIEASLDIDVRNPEGVDIPTSQRFAQLEALVQTWTARYEELANQLNMGLDRIQMMTMRRTSLSTGRLVPIYNAQEFDDQATPQRRYPLIDTDQLMFNPPPPPTIPPNDGSGFYGW